jgi:probable HAF family extracellular repeat protein
MCVLHCLRLSLLATACFCLTSQAETRYRVQNLGEIDGGGLYSVGAINNAGWVAGYTISGAAILRNGRFEYLPPVDGSSHHEIFGFNERGDVAGFVVTEGPDRAFLYTGGRMVDVAAGLLNNRSSVALDVNNAGHVVGYASSGFAGDSPRGYFFDGTSSRYLPMAAGVNGMLTYGLNDHDVIVGRALLNGGGERAFMHDGTQMTFLPALPSGQFINTANDINNAGQILLNDFVDGRYRGFVYQNNAYQDIGTLGGFTTAPLDINEKGWVVGFSSLAGSDAQYAVISKNGVMRNLNNMLAPDDSSAWTLRLAISVNDRGQIVGIGSFNGAPESAFLATPVPEPGTAAMLLAGLGLVVAWRRFPSQPAITA